MAVTHAKTICLASPGWRFLRVLANFSLAATSPSSAAHRVAVSKRLPSPAAVRSTEMRRSRWGLRREARQLRSSTTHDKHLENDSSGCEPRLLAEEGEERSASAELRTSIITRTLSAKERFCSEDCAEVSKEV